MNFFVLIEPVLNHKNTREAAYATYTSSIGGVQIFYRDKSFLAPFFCLILTLMLVIKVCETFTDRRVKGYNTPLFQHRM